MLALGSMLQLRTYRNLALPALGASRLQELFLLLWGPPEAPSVATTQVASGTLRDFFMPSLASVRGGRSTSAECWLAEIFGLLVKPMVEGASRRLSTLGWASVATQATGASLTDAGLE